MDKKIKVILKKMVSEVGVINEMIDGIGKKQFMKDEKKQRAVAMTLFNIGVPIEFRQEHSEVPWREAAGLRDVVAHKYQTIRMEDVWATIKDVIPVFHNHIVKILKQ
jgi:uncharacterized protein with HEPN domain